jgi:dipeptidyl aminopeptidase/acylaminoacyl peptidase
VLSRRWVARLLAVGVVLVVLAYAGLSWKLFDVISRVDPHCGFALDGSPRFTTYTPASFGTAGLPANVAANVDTAAYAMPVFQEVAINSRDGLQLAAWWIPADRPNAPVVIMAHGAGSCRRDPVMLLPAGMLHRNGFAVLMIDLRNQGDSTVTDGRFAGGTREYLDVLGRWDWVRARGIPASRIGLFGESNGASTVVIAAGAEPQVAATWEDSGYADAWAAISEEVVRHGFPEALTFGARLWGLLDGIDLDLHRPLDAIPLIGNRPLMIVQGLADARVDPHNAVEFSAALQAVRGRASPDSLWLVPGAAHVQSAFTLPAEYERRLAAFFGTALGAP